MARRSRSCLLLAMLCTALSGCYLVHERPLPVDGGVDAAHVVLPVDTGPPPDVGHDGGVSPPDPERDGAVDVPPDAWRAEGSTPNGVTLESIGVPIAIDDSPDAAPGDAGGPASIVWNGSGWGVVWSSTIDVRLRVLDQDGVPLRASRRIADAPWPGFATVDFGIGRYAILTASGDDASLRLFDRETRPVSATTSIVATLHADVARLSDAHQWIIAARGETALDHAVVVQTIDDDMREHDARITFPGDHEAEDGTPVAVATLKTRALVAWGTADREVAMSAFTGAPLTQVSDVTVLPALGPRTTHDGDADGVVVRPLAAGFVLGQSDGNRATVYFVDPWSTAVRGPFALPVQGERGNGPLIGGFASVPERGIVGVCMVVRPPGTSRERDEVVMQLIHVDGELLGDPFVVARGLPIAATVDCAWNGTDFVLAWWLAGGWNQLYTQRVHPTFM